MTLALFGAPTTLEALRGRIDQGFDELIFNLASEPADQVLPKLDQLAALVAAVKKS